METLTMVDFKYEECRDSLIQLLRDLQALPNIVFHYNLEGYIGAENYDNLEWDLRNTIKLLDEANPQLAARMVNQPPA